MLRCLLVSISAALAAPLSQAAVSFTESTLTLLPEDASAPFYSGVAMGVVDMNGDGKDDIVRFWKGKDLEIRHQTTPGAVFSKLTGPSFATIRVGVAAADHDGNGMRDLTCGGYSGGTTMLTANASGSAFSSALLEDTNIVMQGMNFVDLDNDGDVDVFACDDVDDNHKYRNDGGGSFPLDQSLIDTFIPAASGQNVPNAGNYASIWTDFDNDGDLDMYLSKCWSGAMSDPTQKSRINRLFRQNIDGTFTDVAPSLVLDSGDQSWCTDFGDIDNDGDLDLFVINHVSGGVGGPSQLFLNQGNGSYVDHSAAAGISFVHNGIQALFRDLDNDGFADLLLSTNGSGYGIFMNDGDGTFTEQTSVLTDGTTGSGTPITHIQTVAVGDLNSDGWLDLYVGRGFGYNNPSNTNRDRLYLNDGGSNHHLQVRLAGNASNPDGIGARLELHGAWGVQLREVRSGEGYGITNSLTQHFGLGATTSIDKLVVRWPSGAIDVIDSPTADQALLVEEGTSPADFDEWRALNFSAAEMLDLAISGPDANPDEDRLVNLFEWYFRTHPKLPRSSRDEIASFSIEDEPGNQRRLKLQIERQPVPGVDEFAEVTSNLTQWQSGTPFVEVVSDTDSELIFRSEALGDGFHAIRFQLNEVPPPAASSN